MTWNKAIEERIKNAINDIEEIQTLFMQNFGEECLADKEIAEVLQIAKAEHEVLQQYRAIGTVEECLKAREKQITKIPDIWGDGCDNDGNIIYDMYDCPNCGERYEIDYHDYKFCPECFVSVDKYDNIIGYIVYAVDWSAMSADRFGIISYRKNSIEFAKDIYGVVCDLFEKYHMNRISWWAFADNPAIRGYRNFIKKHGGRECGYYRQTARLQDGLLHDSVTFEILAEEFHK